MGDIERRIFSATDFSREVEIREHFGWHYVKQSPRSRTTRSYHAGGGTRVGGGFIMAGTTTYSVTTWVDIECWRDKRQPHYAEIAECERAFDAALDPWPLVSYAGIFNFFAVPLLIVGIGMLQYVPLLETWVQRVTSDWNEWHLAALSLALLPFILLFGGLLMRLAFWMEGSRRRRHEEKCDEQARKRSLAWERAARLRQGLA